MAHGIERKPRSFERTTAFALVAPVVALTVCLSLARPLENVVQRVSWPRCRVMLLDEPAGKGKNVKYLFNADKNEILAARFESGSSVSLSVYGPKNQLIAPKQGQNAKSWTGVLSQTGEYAVEVSSTAPESKYSLALALVNAGRFNPSSRPPIVPASLEIGGDPYAGLFVADKMDARRVIEHVRQAQAHNQPPMISISLDRHEVSSSSGSTEVKISISSTDPDGDTLEYLYSTTGGRISGDGPNAIWDLSGVRPGTYTIVVEVSDSCSTVVFSSQTVRVID